MPREIQLEDALVQLGRNARAVIMHGNLDPALVQRARDQNFTGAAQRLAGILAQVGKYPGQAGLPGQHGGQALQILQVHP